MNRFIFPYIGFGDKATWKAEEDGVWCFRGTVACTLTIEDVLGIGNLANSHQPRWLVANQSSVTLTLTSANWAFQVGSGNTQIAGGTGITLLPGEFVHIEAMGDFLGVLLRSPRSGTSSFSGTGAQTAFVIPHGLGAVPRATWNPSSAAGASPFYVTVDATNITVNYVTAPATGTNNVTGTWTAVL